MRVEDRLRHATPPDAGAAHERAARVVDSVSVPVRRRRRWPAAGVLAATLAAAVALTPPGDAVARWVRDLVTTENHAPPAPRPMLGSLPGPGRLLVGGPSGAFVVGRDGARHRIGAFDDLAWSPRGLFVAGTRGDTLAAVAPDGSPRWAVTRDVPVSDPVWARTGYRVAYRAGTDLRVVAGDGSGDHPLASNMADVPPAWAPGRHHWLVAAHAGGSVQEYHADDPAFAGWAVGGGPVRALQWTGSHHVVIVRARHLQVVCGGGCVQRHPLPPVDRAAIARDGETIAVATGRTVRLVSVRDGAQRIVLEAAGPVEAMAFSPDGSRLLVTSRDQWVFVPLRPPARITAVKVRGFPVLGGWCCG
jgi:hypothetical protein